MRSCLLLLALLAGAAPASLAQTSITPAQAIQSVCQFCGEPLLACTVAGPYESESAWYFGTHFYVKVSAGPWKGQYTVRAEDASIAGADFDSDPPQDPPALSMAECQGIAEQFAAAHYPPFAQRQWLLMPEWLLHRQGGYGFVWNWVLNEHGTLGPFHFSVDVDGNSGRVISYSAPPDRITGPTVPQVSLAQAMLIAAPFARYDPQVVPFSWNYLQLLEDQAGVQWLTWFLTQHPYPEQPDVRYTVLIDAITGEYEGLLAPLGFAADPKRPGQRAPCPPVAVRRADGVALPGAHHAGDRLWVRVEALKSLGARVSLPAARPPEVRAGDRVLTAEQLGAERRDYGWWAKPRKPVGCPGWWVPVRKAAEALGWRVEWSAAKREVIVHAPGS